MVLLAAFAVIEVRSTHALVPIRVLRSQDRTGAYLVSLCVGTALFGIFFFLTIFVQNVWGYSPLKTGIAFLPLVAVIIVLSGVASQAVNRIGARPLLIAGSASMARGCSGCPGSASTAATPAACSARCWSSRPAWAYCSCR